MLFNTLLTAEEFSIPEPFRNGEPIEQVILISDVDGVIRENIDAIADPRVIHAVKSLLKHKSIDVTFISGTPIENAPNPEAWRRGNVPLSRVFGPSFTNELMENRVTIFGVLGGHKMNPGGGFEVVDEYSPEISWKLGKLLIQGFLSEVLEYGTPPQQTLAKNLSIELNSSDDFNPIASAIREHLDPNFKILFNGASIETQTSNPPWNTALTIEWLKNELNQLSNLPLANKQIAGGFARKGEIGFNFLLISKTNKGITTKEHIQEKIKHYPKALIITIGDTQVDFPMHKNAHIAFHVGLEKVHQNNPLPHCYMIRDQAGADQQHVEGTLKVLSLLEDAIGKSFYDFKHIPKCDSSGRWDYYSIKELQTKMLSPAS